MVKAEDLVLFAGRLIGIPYVFGAEVSPSTPIADIRALDCSELVEYVCKHFGLKVPDGSQNQYRYCNQYGAIISVEEAWATAGALLFRRDAPTFIICHVAISTGDGYTIEARGVKYGTGRFERRNTFTDAALIPAVTYIFKPQKA